MNERIRKLAIKAFDTINAISSEGVADRHTFEQEWFQLYNQRFAELIYKDIITVVAAQALLNESALDVFKNLKRLYEGEEQ